VSDSMIPAYDLCAAWDITPSRMRALCIRGQIPGAEQRIIKGHAVWHIPKDSVKPPNQKSGPKPKK
jgi:hypothetical protein